VVEQALVGWSLKCMQAWRSAWTQPAARRIDLPIDCVWWTLWLAVHQAVALDGRKHRGATTRVCIRIHWM